MASAVACPSCTARYTSTSRDFLRRVGPGGRQLGVVTGAGGGSRTGVPGAARDRLRRGRGHGVGCAGGVGGRVCRRLGGRRLRAIVLACGYGCRGGGGGGRFDRGGGLRL